MNEEIVSNSNEKIAQLYVSIKNRIDKKYIERILQKDKDINMHIPKNCNNNLLHFAFNQSNIKTFKLLLDYKADFTIKNNQGFTVIHRVINEKKYNFELSRNKFHHPFIDAILSAHVRFVNASNPICNNGFSHFHAACMSDNVEAVEFFLSHGISTEQSVNINSPIFAGYTPLHFAARYSCLSTIKVLLKYGANVNSRESKGLTALSILIDRKINNKETNDHLIKLLIDHDSTIIDDFGLSNLHAACTLEDNSTIIIINDNINKCIDYNSPVCPGYTPLHFATLFNVNTMRLLVNKGADVDAKDIKNVSSFELCLQSCCVEDIYFVIMSKQQWVNIVLSDMKTRLIDLVFAMTSIEKINIFMKNVKSIEDLTIPRDSTLWPGFTFLHLAVILSGQNDMEIIEECLTRGCEITKVDVRGLTPLHLAFYLQKIRVVEFLLKHHDSNENPIDSNNLSHFHIACAARDKNAVERFLSNDIDVNMKVNTTVKCSVMCNVNLQSKPRYFFIVPGSTALHINVASGNVKITKMLIDNGADIYAKDENGFTPIHRLFTSRTALSYENVDEILLNINGLRDDIAKCGLTHLHVASFLDSVCAVEKLVDSKADIDARVCLKNLNDRLEVDRFYDPYGDPSKEPLTFLSRYDGFTALNFAMHRRYFQVKQFLLDRGADVFVENDNTSPPIFDILLYYSNTFMPILMDKIEWQIRLEEQFGLTMLHLACQTINLDMVEKLLNSGVYVNVKIHENCQIWPGYTPLHLAVNMAVRYGSENCENDSNKIVQLLLDYGADVTMMNCDGDTPVHIIDDGSKRRFADSPHVNLLLNTLKDFSVNPISSQGISFFHIACIKKDFIKIEKYLKHGVDVNQAICNFSEKYPGCPPLHLAAGYRSESFNDVTSQLKVIDLLLVHGADVNSKDVYDNTALHVAAEHGSSRELLFDRIIRNGADVHAENIFGETPLELLAKSGNATWEELHYLLTHGCHINSYNPITNEGYVPKIFISPKANKDSNSAHIIVRQLIRSDYITEVDKQGRTFLHNLASVINLDNNHAWHRDDLIERLLERGCRINQRDMKGRTALHTAAIFRNAHGIRCLLKYGADVNEVDRDDKTAFSYIFEKSPCSNIEKLIELFVMHIHTLELCGLHVNEDNRQLKIKAMKDYCLDSPLKRFEEGMERTKRIKIGSTSFTLYDFCFKMVYTKMSYADRNEVDKYFENLDNENNFRDMDYVFTLKYKKVSKELRLIKPALESFSELTKYQIPELCCRIILSFLTSADLENVIALIT